MLPNRAKQGEGLCRRSQVAHVPREYREKRSDLFPPEFNGDAGFLGPTNLRSQFGVEASKESVRLRGKLEDDCDFAVRDT